MGAEEDLKEAFRVFDYKKDGTVSVNCLRTVLKLRNEPLEEDEVNQLIQDARPVDGVVRYVDFIRNVLKRE